MGSSWLYILYSENEFYLKHPDCPDTAALIIPYKRQIHFIKDHTNIGIIRHEVRHAFISELCLDAADLTIDQFEEIQCTLDQNKWEEMNEVSTVIYKNLNSK